MLGAAWPIVPISGGIIGGDEYRDGYLYRMVRIIPASVHGMSNGETGWVFYTAQDNNLRSVANGGKVVNGTFLDHRFETSGGTPLAFELEDWNASTGLIRAWLRLTGFRQNVDYTIYHYYGKTDVGAEESNATGCWDGFLCSVDPTTGSDMSGNERNFDLTGITPASLLGARAGDIG